MHSPTVTPPGADGTPARKYRRSPIVRWLKLGGYVVGAIMLFGLGISVGQSEQSASTRPVVQAAAPAKTITVTAPPSVTTVTVAGPAPAASTVTVPGPATTITVHDTVTAPAQGNGPASGPAPGIIPGDGTFQVGTDVQPGTYKSAGAAPGGIGDCYWARLGPGGGDNILDNNLTPGQSVVTIRPSDKEIETRGCQDFHKVG